MTAFKVNATISYRWFVGVRLRKCLQVLLAAVLIQVGQTSVFVLERRESRSCVTGNYGSVDGSNG